MLLALIVGRFEMKLYSDKELAQCLDNKIFRLLSETADKLGLECYVVGGYVRDIFLERAKNDIDVVVVGNGLEMAKAFGKALGRGAHVSLFKISELHRSNREIWK